MSDGKQRLPIYAGPSQVAEENFLPYESGNVIAGNCFRLYAFSERKDETGNREEEDKLASSYFMKGLKVLHEGYVAASMLDLRSHQDKMERAFAYFHQALAAKPDYFCARKAFGHTAELLGQPDVAEKEEYALQMSDNPHPEMPCHLMHPGFYSASDLSKLEESLKEKRE